MYYSFDCGCQIPIVDEKIKECDGLPSLWIDYNSLNESCMKTWSLFASGKTKGIYQLEKGLGKKWSKDIKPTSIEDISALVSLIRPGVLNSFLDGRNMAQHYVDRKFGVETFEYIHPALEQILGVTFGVLTYQEQAINIASIIAGFNLQEADSLRKAAGKKDAKLMKSLETSFVDGCEKTGLVTREQGEELFDNIQKSNRYSFNKSHGIGYGKTSYWTGYTKAHFPLHFCCSYLHFARERPKPQEEIDEIIVDAKELGVDILTPDIRNFFDGDIGDFSLVSGKIDFGVRSIKGCGDSHVAIIAKKIKEGEKILNKSIDQWNWIELLFVLFLQLNKTVVNGVISVGGVSHLGISRQTMLHDYNLCLHFDEKDKEKILANIKHIHSIGDALELLRKYPKLHKARLKKYQDIDVGLSNTPFSTEDSIDWIADKERFYLGSSISCSKCEAISTTGNTSCKEFNDGKNDKNITIVGEIKSIRDFLLKNGNLAGQKMCFGTIEDSSGRIDFALSPKEYENYKDELFKGNIVLLSGQRGKNNNLKANRVVSL